jgi:hypothetical protein
VKNLDLVLRKGATWKLPIMWESTRLIYKPISAIANTSPIRVTAVGHGVPDGWKVAVTNVKGPTAINSTANPPRDIDFKPVNVASVDILEFNKINAAAWPSYVSGGQVVYYEPASLTDLQARMQIKNKVGGAVLHEMSTADGGITIDSVNSRIVLSIDADVSSGFTWKRGVYDLEVFDTSGVVTPLLYGTVSLTSEVTTPV